METVYIFIIAIFVLITSIISLTQINVLGLILGIIGLIFSIIIFIPETVSAVDNIYRAFMVGTIFINIFCLLIVGEENLRG